jgi:predicted transcriptional regulator
MVIHRMSSEPENGAGPLFFELAGNLRLSMLSKFREKSYRLSQLASELNATMQETHRNVVRLVEAGLILKDSDGQHMLTPYGKVVVELLPSLTFLHNHREYFLEHDISDLPMQLIHRLGSLANCEVVHGVLAIVQRWKNLYLESKSYIKEIMGQVPVDLIEVLSTRIESGIKFSYIFGRDSVIPKGRSEILHKVGWTEFISKGLVSRRMLETVKIMVILNESDACVLFPNLKGEPDLNTMFYSNDKEFHSWSNELFELQWKLASSFDESKLMAEV